MNQRKFGKTNRMVSEIGLGTWQLGTKWGDPFNEAEALRILQASYESGINLIDTADIYNDGNSERAIGKFIAQHKNHFFVVTKCGRGLNPHTAEGYTAENMEHFIDGSLQRLGGGAAGSGASPLPAYLCLSQGRTVYRHGQAGAKGKNRPVWRQH